MTAAALRAVLREVSESELERFGRVSDRLLAGRPLEPRDARTGKPRPGRGVEFERFRPYAFGDDPRAVDWRASARSTQLQVRERRSDAASVWLLCLDRSSSMASDPAKWRLAVQVTAAFAYLLLRREHRVALAVFSAQVDAFDAPGRGRARYGRLLGRLAETEPLPRGGATRLECCAPRLPAGASALVVSDFLAPDFLRPGLDRLRSRGASVHAMAVSSRADVTAPALATGERAVLCDAESGERFVAQLGVECARVAERRRADLFEALCEHARRSHIRLSAADASISWRDAVLRHLLCHA